MFVYFCFVLPFVRFFFVLGLLFLFLLLFVLVVCCFGCVLRFWLRDVLIKMVFLGEESI